VKASYVLFFWCKFYFAGDKLLTTPNPDVNEDMKMFEMLGLNPQNLSQKFSTTNR
jgi:biotin synthase-like enzyme